EDGKITLYSFCEGFAPFKAVLDPWDARYYNISMSLAPADSLSINLSAAIAPSSAKPGWYELSGKAMHGTTPLCAMALANGQHMFSCGGDGSYNLEVPLNSEGKITLYGFCEGFAPYKIILEPDNGGSSAFTNSLGMTFNLISAGTFMMGSPEDEPGRSSDETLHQVTLTQNFYMQTTEITQGQWKAVMGSNPSYFQNCGDGCPVETVSWDDVQGFITKMNQRREGIYRLPTEAEWEYAARAGSSTAFANGNLTVADPYSCNYDSNLDAIGWYCGNSDVTYNGCYDTSGWGGPSCAGTHSVAGKQPNVWGLYDMSGNVWEWCQDWYGDYPTSAVTNPTGSPTGLGRVIRGNSWLYDAGYCRSAYRFSKYPTNRLINLGFRLAFFPSQ
ncbi:MAG: formylglycine-generating enzyme family protein, partial [Desulfobacterales bacterium]|nr:formylglycine-generating enzyme family protein [Desulfobacterales bacterium]